MAEFQHHKGQLLREVGNGGSHRKGGRVLRALLKAGYNWQKNEPCAEYRYFAEPDGYGQLTIMDRKSPQFDKELTGDTQIVFGN